MILKKLMIISLFFIINTALAENYEVNKLLEKVTQAPSIEEKKELIEELKEKLADENKKVREKSDAIIKAKKKVPLKLYKQTPLEK